MNKPDGRYRYVRGMWDREKQKLIESDPVMEGMDYIDAYFSKAPIDPTARFVAQLFWIIGNYLRELDKRNVTAGADFDPRRATAADCCKIAGTIRRLRDPSR